VNGIHEVSGSIPLGSTNEINKLTTLIPFGLLRLGTIWVPSVAFFLVLRGSARMPL
jgi:hypothetical protein